MEIVNLVRPKTMDEAFEFLTEKKAFLLGGGAWSRMNPKKVEYAVDLSTLDLRYIRDAEGRIEIGAMVTARDIETSGLLRERFGGIFRDSVKNIVGVQMRNIISVGGTVAGRYGFSELNTAFLAMNAQVALYKGGELDFQSFLSGGEREPALIEKIVLGPAPMRGAYQSVRNTKTDLPILNVAAAYGNGAWRIAVGARPGAALLAQNASKSLGRNPRPDGRTVEEASRAAAEEIVFGRDIRGEADYRKSVCAVLVRRAILEVEA